MNTELKQAEGKIYVVGSGPGDLNHMTEAAKCALLESHVVVGFTTYMELIKELVKDKEVITSVMTKEKDRVGAAIDEACKGKTVSLVSGGDPGVYALAGLLFELLRARNVKWIRNGTFRTFQVSESETTKSLAEPDRLNEDVIRVEVIPGVPALCACGASLGAPLMHDFAAISLSDRLTSWETIEKRLHAAGSADFVVCIYNPKSKGRTWHIDKALEIISSYREPKTPVGISKNAKRQNEELIITTLDSVPTDKVDMQSTLIVGNSTTFIYNNVMVTPRGYKGVENVGK